MSTPVNTLKGAEKILVAISGFDYLTAEQATRLLYNSNDEIKDGVKLERTGHE